MSLGVAFSADEASCSQSFVLHCKVLRGLRLLPPSGLYSSTVRSFVDRHTAEIGVVLEELVAVPGTEVEN